MPLLAIIAAGLAGWAFGAVWYGIFAKPWMSASGVATDDSGRPANQKKPVALCDKYRLGIGRCRNDVLRVQHAGYCDHWQRVHVRLGDRCLFRCSLAGHQLWLCGKTFQIDSD